MNEPDASNLVRGFSRRVWGVGLIVVVLVVDQLTKAWVLGDARFNAMACLEMGGGCGAFKVLPFLDLSMVWNRGVSFGAFQSEGVMRWVLGLVSLGIAGGFAFWLWKAVRWTEAVGVALIIGGAIGNLIDRFRFGAVVDFVDVGAVGFPWVFNVADAGVTIGAGLLILDLVLAGSKRTG